MNSPTVITDNTYKTHVAFHTNGVKAKKKMWIEYDHENTGVL